MEVNAIAVGSVKTTTTTTTTMMNGSRYRIDDSDLLTVLRLFTLIASFGVIYLAYNGLAESGDKNRFCYSRKAKASLVRDFHGLKRSIDFHHLLATFCSFRAELIMLPYPPTVWCDCLPPSHPPASCSS